MISQGLYGIKKWLNGSLQKFRYIKFGRHVFVSPLFLFLCSASLAGGYLDYFALAYISAVLHELAHMACARLLKIPILRIEVMPFGICGRLGVAFIREPKKEIAVAIIGPLTSGLLAVVIYCFGKFLPMYSYLIDYCFKINLSLMFLNFLPTLPLDGGRIMRAILSQFMGAIRAYNISIAISRVVVGAMLICSVILLLECGFNFSYILIGVFLLGSLSSEQKNISLMSLKEILYHKDKLYSMGLCSAVYIASLENVPARRILRMISSHKYYVIDVVNKDGKILKTVTESQVLSALTQKSIRLTMGEVT